MQIRFTNSYPELIFRSIVDVIKRGDTLTFLINIFA